MLHVVCSLQGCHIDFWGWDMFVCVCALDHQSNMDFIKQQLAGVYVDV